MTKRIRFWVFINCAPVRLTLVEGQSLHHFSSCRHDEGWSSIANVWSYDDATITNEWHDDGTDCDGRHTHTGMAWCQTEGLRAGSPDMDDPSIVYPDWLHGRTRVYDQFAQAAGY